MYTSKGREEFNQSYKKITINFYRINLTIIWRMN